VRVLQVDSTEPGIRPASKLDDLGQERVHADTPQLLDGGVDVVDDWADVL
jgi:hypothetical protein